MLLLLHLGQFFSPRRFAARGFHFASLIGLRFAQNDFHLTKFIYFIVVIMATVTNKNKPTNTMETLTPPQPAVTTAHTPPTLSVMGKGTEIRELHELQQSRSTVTAILRLMLLAMEMIHNQGKM